MSGFELAATGQTLSILIPIIAGVLLIAGLAAVIIPRLRRAKQAQEQGVERRAVARDSVQAENLDQAEITDRPESTDRPENTEERPDEDRQV